MIHKTKNGTELPLLNLRGKEYLEVKFRIVWFREEHPEWSIETEIIHRDKDSATARATIRDEKGRIIATSHKVEDRNGFADFLEKAETGAIGRALALIGFGTQFCADELDEGKRIVDSPAQPVKKANQAESNINAFNEVAKDVGLSSPEEFFDGDYIVQKGLKKNQPLKAFQIADCENYLSFFKTSSKSQEYKLVAKWNELLKNPKNPPPLEDGKIS